MISLFECINHLKFTNTNMLDDLWPLLVSVIPLEIIDDRAIITLILIVCTIVNAIVCMRNFNKGKMDSSADPNHYRSQGTCNFGKAAVFQCPRNSAATIRKVDAA